MANLYWNSSITFAASDVWPFTCVFSAELYVVICVLTFSIILFIASSFICGLVVNPLTFSRIFIKTSYSPSPPTWNTFSPDTESSKSWPEPWDPPFSWIPFFVASTHTKSLKVHGPGGVVVVAKPAKSIFSGNWISVNAGVAVVSFSSFSKVGNMVTI